ncbi:MAG: DUF1700 domain-containing protein [Lachnospiraceae bacterium]|nr:DUF1700 domain-containing protein [Lachnospiraceae bacterium]
MTKREFLESLRLALAGKVTSAQLAENLEYYEDYINTETRKGRDEEEVLSELGDPRLIARTIAETRRQTGGYGDSDSRHDGGQAGRYAEYGEEGEWSRPDRGYRPRGPVGQGRVSLFGRIPVWAWLILVLVVVVLILSAIFSVITALLPILLPILGVLFLVKLFRDWLN